MINPQGVSQPESSRRALVQTRLSWSPVGTFPLSSGPSLPSPPGDPLAAPSARTHPCPCSCIWQPWAKCRCSQCPLLQANLWAVGSPVLTLTLMDTPYLQIQAQGPLSSHSKISDTRLPPHILPNPSRCPTALLPLQLQLLCMRSMACWRLFLPVRTALPSDSVATPLVPSLTFSSIPMLSLTTLRSGGSGISVTKALLSHKLSHGGDPTGLGCWTIFQFQGQVGHSFSVFSTYCPCFSPTRVTLCGHSITLISWTGRPRAHPGQTRCLFLIKTSRRLSNNTLTLGIPLFWELTIIVTFARALLPSFSSVWASVILSSISAAPVLPLLPRTATQPTHPLALSGCCLVSRSCKADTVHLTICELPFLITNFCG